MDSFGYSVQLLLKEIFVYRNRQIHELDQKPCARCGEIPYIPVVQKTLHNGRTITYPDRSVRVDCDKTTGKKPMMETYHFECWLQALSIE